jgi:hypothetical protein
VTDTRPKLFLSHAGADTEAARRVKSRIEAAPEAMATGLKVWFDKDDLLAGPVPWQHQLEAAISEWATGFAVYVGSAGVVNWVEAEVRLALSRAMVSEGRFPFVPIIAAAAGGSAALPGFARQFQGVIDVENRPEEFRKLLAAAVGGAEAGTLQAEAEPFFGLRAIDEKRCHLFFGRDQETEEVLLRLGRSPILIVDGDSGSGKSSLVKAGVVPRWRGGALAEMEGRRPADDIWHVIELQPGRNPRRALGEAVERASRQLSNSFIDVDKMASAAEQGTIDTVRRALRCGLPPDATRTLLVVDQFEELVTLTPRDLREPFARLLQELAEPGDKAFSIIITMRRDYYNLLSSPECRALYERVEADDLHAHYRLGRMSDDGLRRIVIEPLLLAGIERRESQELADELLRDVGQRPGDLALVQFALTRAWERRHEFNGQLVRAYAGVGRVDGALAREAERVFKGVLAGGQEEAEVAATLMRLARLEGTAGPTRRIARHREFTSKRWTLLQTLASEEGNRLVLIGSRAGADGVESDSAEETAEIAHEALLTRWPRLHAWLNEAPDDKRVLDRLAERAAEWARAFSTAAKDRLLARTDAEREVFQALGIARPIWLSAEERSFVDASIADHSNRQRRERFLKTGAIITAAIATALAFAAVYASIGFYLAQERAEFALGQGLWRELEFSGSNLTTAEINALWQISEASGRVRDGFLAPLTSDHPDPSAVLRFARRPKTVSRALGLAGFSRAFAETILTAVLESLSTSTDPRQIQALSEAIAALPAHATPDQTSRALAPVLRALADPTNYPHLGELATALRALAPVLTTEQAGAAMNASLHSLMRTANPEQLLALAGAMQALAQDQNANQARVILISLSEALRSTADAHQILALTEAAQVLADRLDRIAAADRLAALLRSFRGTMDPASLQAFGPVVQSMVDKLSPKDVEAQLDSALVALDDPTDYAQLQAIRRGLVVLAGKLPSDYAGIAFTKVSAELTATIDPDRIQALAGVVQAIARKLSVQDAANARNAVFAAWRISNDPFAIESLADALHDIPGTSSSEQLSAARDHAFALFDRLRDPEGLAALARALRLLSISLTRAQVDAVGAHFIPVFLKATDPDELMALASAVEALADNLPEDAARMAQDAFVSAMTNTSDPDRLAALTLAVRSLRIPLDHPAAHAALAAHLRVLGSTTDPDQLTTIANGVQALAAKLDAADSQSAVSPIVLALEGIDPAPLPALEQALEALLSRLNEAQLRESLRSIYNEIGTTTDPNLLKVQAQMFAAIAKRLTPDEADRMSKLAQWHLAEAKAPAEASAWAAAIVALAKVHPDAMLSTLVDALKYPTAAGAATDILLDAIHGVAPDVEYQKGSLADALPGLEQLLGSDHIKSAASRPSRPNTSSLAD